MWHPEVRSANIETSKRPTVALYKGSTKLRISSQCYPPFPEIVFVIPSVPHSSHPASLCHLFPSIFRTTNLFPPSALLKSIFKIPLYVVQPISDSYSHGIYRIDTFKIQFSMTTLLPLTTKRCVQLQNSSVRFKFQDIASLNRNKATSHTFWSRSLLFIYLA